LRGAQRRSNLPPDAQWRLARQGIASALRASQ